MASTFFDFAKRGRPLTLGALLSTVGCAGGQDVSETFDSLSDTATETVLTSTLSPLIDFRMSTVLWHR